MPARRLAHGQTALRYGPRSRPAAGGDPAVAAHPTTTPITSLHDGSPSRELPVRHPASNSAPSRAEAGANLARLRAERGGSPRSGGSATTHAPGRRRSDRSPRERRSGPRRTRDRLLLSLISTGLSSAFIG